MKPISVWVPATYLVVAGVAFALPYFASGPEAGIWFVLLTLPWPMVLVPLLDGIGPGLIGGTVGSVCFAAGAVVNAIVLYLILRRFERRREGR